MSFVDFLLIGVVFVPAVVFFCVAFAKILDMFTEDDRY